MAKIMLVEDDTNLSEIYQARLTAEGYEIVSAHDGEEALALAAKEKPDLIVSDVMMPKISGFEMLDILRNTEGLKEAKVIMLTALGQAEDQTRAESLGADRYLVKSQVTLEDIVKAAQELLEGAGVPGANPAPAAPAPAPTPVVMATAPTPMEVTAPPPVAVPTVPPAPTVPVSAPPAAAPAPSATVAAPPAAPLPQPLTSVPPAPTPAAAPQPFMAPPAPMPDPLPVPAPTPVTPAPAAPPTSPQVPTPPAPVENPTVATDNKIVADAVDDLIEGIPDKAAAALAAAPAMPPASETVMSAPEHIPAPFYDPTPAPGSASAPAPVADVTPENDMDSDADNKPHKKVIKPITDDIAQPKPSLESLLADEERKNPSPLSSTPAPAAPEAPVANAPVSNVPHQPGHIITPSAEQSLNNGNGIDPNSIAL